MILAPYRKKKKGWCILWQSNSKRKYLIIIEQSTEQTQVEYHKREMEKGIQQLYIHQKIFKWVTYLQHTIETIKQNHQYYCSISSVNIFDICGIKFSLDKSPSPIPTKHTQENTIRKRTTRKGKRGCQDTISSLFQLWRCKTESFWYMI